METSAFGQFCHSLNLTDIYTTWTEPPGPKPAPC